MGERLALGVVGAALVALPFVLVGGLRGHAFPRGLLLMPVFGCALIVLALR